VVVDTANRRVTVTVPRTSAGGNPIDLFFARVLGHNSSDVSAKATAEAGTQGSASRCVKPIFIPNTILSSRNPVYPAACNAGEVLFDSAGNITSYATARLGSSMSVRPTSPSSALAPGQFFSLDFGSGGSTYRCAWGQCLNYCGGASEIKCGDKYPVETGNMVGPTRQGIRDLVGSPADRWIGIGQYDVGGVTMTTSKSLVVAPIWNNCDPNNQITSGNAGQKVEVIGFAEIFIDGMQGSNVTAHFVAPIACPRNGGGGGGAGDPNPSTGPYAVPVRLVQTQ
jgi:hypothetical protein